MHPAIELFRGIAAFMVLTSHYAYFFTSELSFLNFLQTGVDLFFIISGFVFAPLILSGNIAIKPYLIRRFFRIYPLYFFSLLLYYGFAPDDPQKFTFFIDHLFFLHTTHSVEELNFFNTAYWTLPIEAEFYLLVPFLVIASVKNKYFLGKIFIFAILLKTILSFQTDFSNLNLSAILNAHLPGFLIEFLLGILLFKLYAKYKDKKIPLIFHLLIIIAAIILLYGLNLFFLSHDIEQITNGNLLFKSYFRFWCAISYAILLFPFLFIINSKSIFNNVYIFMGNISYGVYLFHNLTPQIFNHFNYQLSGLTGYLLCLSITIMITLIFYYTIENPARILGRKLSKTVTL